MFVIMETGLAGLTLLFTTVLLRSTDLIIVVPVN